MTGEQRPAVLVIARMVGYWPSLCSRSRWRIIAMPSKVYWPALTRGVLKQEAGHDQAAALAKEGARGADRMAIIADHDDAKFAITDYAVVDRAGEEFAWVAAKPVTGRTHQIRVHLASLGTPIVGDFSIRAQAARGEVARSQISFICMPGPLRWQGLDGGQACR